MRALCVALGLGMVVEALSGCGGSGGGEGGGVMRAPDTCGTVDPCGGDLTGTWKVLGGCITPAETDDADCAQETFKLTTLSYGGSVNFDPGSMTYATTNFIRMRVETDTFPSVCLSPYTSETCADKDQAYRSQVSRSGTGLTSASCSGSTTCTCNVAAKDEPIGTGGTYTAQGNVLQFTVNSGTAIDSYGPLAFCVQGDLLHLMVAATAIQEPSGTQTEVVYEDIVAQKQ
ncbi:MAG TPA: hypothetical protein VMT03_23980 [Polyangia bacterium]|nr:hypothetical protein [Polyangia bacterium]